MFVYFLIRKIILLATMIYFSSHPPGSETGVTNIAAALFMITALPAFAAAGYMPSVLLERPLFYREQNDGCYRVINYLVFKILEEQVGVARRRERERETYSHESR